MRYYYEIISAKNDIYSYYFDCNKQNNELPIIGLAKYTLVKDKNGKNIKVFVYPENYSDINDGFVDKSILKLYLTYLELEVYEIAGFIKKYIKEDSKKINFIDRLANKSSRNENYGAFIFDNISYDIDKDFEDPERFKKILKETIVNFTKNINIVSFINKEQLPFNLDFHLMMS